GLSGRVEAREGRYRRSQPVRAVVTDVNPYLFQYRLVVGRTVYAEASAADFFKTSFGLAFQPGSAPAAAAPGTPPQILSLFEARNLAECTRAETANSLAVSALIDSLNQHRRRLDTGFNSLSTSAMRAEHLRQARVDSVYDASLPASRVMERIERAVGDVHRFRVHLDSAAEVLEGGARVFAANTAELTARAEDFRESLEDCGGRADVPSSLAVFAADSVRYAANLQQVARRRAVIDSVLTRMGSVHTDPTRFYLARLLPAMEGDGEVVVAVQRHAVRDTDTTYHTISEERLIFRERGRFSIAAGITWSPLDVRSYDKVQRLKNPALADTTVTVIAVTESAPYRVMPTIALNTRLATIPGGDVVDGVHVTLATGLRPQDDVNLSKLEYFGGLGMSGLGGRVFVSLGALFGRETRLTDGARLGDRIPSTATVPTETRMVARLGSSVTFRLK
ncbi:MAG: hypothetical protein AVDCRST_MAG89-3516, partial [uncultured Gemmatimonadetes bacterium]